MKLRTTIPYTLLALPLMIGNAMANPSETKMFGAAAPFTIDKLPVSRLKSRLESLPVPARQKAMKWLHSFNFPEDDTEFLDVDSEGAVFYQDTLLPEEISQEELETNPALEGINPTDTFKLHSKPGSANVVYLNFKGYTVSGTAWNNPVSSYQAKPFNKDSDPSNFSSAERRDIGEIWHRIAEDLAPFNIDVTTERPLSFGPKTGHILITSNIDEFNQAMPASNAGGVAYVNVWGQSNYEYYQPALVYYNNLASAANYISEAATHELGHNLSLSHDGSSTAPYYEGHGTGLTSWGSIMGVGYYTNVTQWSKGEYVGANNTEDDLAIIGGRIPYRADDHSNTFNSATPLLVDANGYIASSNPEIDPLNQRPDNKGIIESSADVDTFYLDVAAGMLDISITPAWDAHTRTSLRGSNLDLKATLYDDSGMEIVSDPSDNTDALISANLPAGRYYLEITGTDNTYTPYSDYASLGQYYISGSVASVSDDTTPPNPDPMGWIDPPVAMSKTSISMTAVDANDESGFVEYQFICTAGGAGCTASAWQAETSYLATGLAANTDYSYQVKARDGSGNETGLSATYSTTTLANIAPESSNDYEIVNENTETVIDVLANDIEPEGEVLQVYSTSVPAHGEVTINNDVILYLPNVGFIGADSFDYTITDGVGGFSTSTVTIDVIEVNDVPVGVEDNAEVLLRGSVNIDVLANDFDPEGLALSVISATNGNKGTTAVNSDGTITYTVSDRNRGGDSFTYTISDGELSSTVVVNVAIVKTLSSDGDTGGDTGGGSKKCNPKKGC